MSRHVAPPAFWKKLACFSATCAPPTLRPLNPAASMRRPAKSPAGFLKNDPQVGLSAGWRDLRSSRLDSTGFQPGMAAVATVNVAPSTNEAGSSRRRDLR